jgi:hypothetical protein
MPNAITIAIIAHLIMSNSHSGTDKDGEEKKGEPPFLSHLPGLNQNHGSHPFSAGTSFWHGG